jgi:hypothetical protein
MLLLLQAFPVQLPTFVARMLAFKLTIDTSKLPAACCCLRAVAWCHLLPFFNFSCHLWVSFQQT